MMAKKRALLIDDQHQWYAVCKVLCGDFGYECVWAETPNAAREQLNDGAFDVLILDLGFQRTAEPLLPDDVSEIDLLLARLQKASKPVNILICTGLNDPTKISLVESLLVGAGHKVRVFRKRDEMRVLYDAFGQLAGPVARTSQVGRKARAVDSAFVRLLGLFGFLFLMTVLAAKILASETRPQFSMAIIGFAILLSVSATLLLLWGVGVLKRADVVHFFDRGVDLFEKRMSQLRPSSSRNARNARPRRAETMQSEVTKEESKAGQSK